MAYSLKTDVRTRLSELADATLFDPILDAAIAQADSEINAHLVQRYVVPIATPLPAQIVELSADLAAVYASLDTSANGKMTDQAKEWQQKCLKTLDELANGRQSLPAVAVKPRFYTGTAPQQEAPGSALADWNWKNRRCGGSGR